MEKELKKVTVNLSIGGVGLSIFEQEQIKLRLKEIWATKNWNDEAKIRFLKETLETAIFLVLQSTKNRNISNTILNLLQ